MHRGPFRSSERYLAVGQWIGIVKTAHTLSPWFCVSLLSNSFAGEPWEPCWVTVFDMRITMSRECWSVSRWRMFNLPTVSCEKGLGRGTNIVRKLFTYTTSLTVSHSSYPNGHRRPTRGYKTIDRKKNEVTRHYNELENAEWAIGQQMWRVDSRSPLLEWIQG